KRSVVRAKCFQGPGAKMKLTKKVNRLLLGVIICHSGEPRIGVQAGVGIQNRLKILDSGSRFACPE
ncbi:MAG: hypothetical protein NTV04_18625, partial [Deltaproteobacteria bacterium]|nr:hypothetical protein [Deltaproteobacteria bacterium]